MVKVQQKETVVVRFAGDSGDGMQVTGSQFGITSAIVGNDVHSFPDYPAEIRAPAGTLAGVSGLQISFSDHDIHTPGDDLDVLVAMNPAALKANLSDLKQGGILLLNQDGFTDKTLQKAGYEGDPREDDTLSRFQVFSLTMTTLTVAAITDEGLTHATQQKCKNMFALGVVYWLYDRPLQPTLNWLAQKFAGEKALIDANQTALQTGYHFAETCELFPCRFTVATAKLPAGEYRQTSGNEAVALACGVAAHSAKHGLLLAGYPITPASTILQQAVTLGGMGVKVLQAEDEMAAVCAAIGAAFGGAIGVTCTSGPGLDLKGEGIGLAVMAELPLVVLDVQRGGPSTGLPTKPEQSDLLAACFGRHGECPVPVLAPATPGECYHVMLEAMHMALRAMTPVIVLGDATLANGTEPWCLPEESDKTDFSPYFTEYEGQPPYKRDEQSFSRPWTLPGQKGGEHRIGGLEKANGEGNISYDPDNHHDMVCLRAEKVRRVAAYYEPLDIIGNPKGDVLVVSWGSTYGPVLTTVEALQAEGHAVSLCHLRHLHPLHPELEKTLSGFNKLFVPEMNNGQLAFLLQGTYLREVRRYNRITGKPFHTEELKQAIADCLGGD